MNNRGFCISGDKLVESVDERSRAVTQFDFKVEMKNIHPVWVESRRAKIDK